jgi:hypothetical protein
MVKEVLTGVGSIQQGMAARNAGKYTRSIMKQNGRNAENDGLEQRDRIRTASRIAMGRQLVAQGGSGFAMGTGSALDELRESATEREIDLATIRRQSAMKRQGFEQQGTLAAAQGRSAMISGMISGATSFIEAGEKAFGPKPTGG